MNIYGASGHAKVIIELVQSQNKNINHIFDDNPDILKIFNYEVEHRPTSALLKTAPLIIGIGENKIRKKVSLKLDTDFAPFQAHASAIVSPSAQIGKATVIMAHATINAEASIGSHCIINTGAVVEHEAQLEDFVHISPNASIAGNVEVGEGSQVGIGACVIPGIKIGKWAVVGAGAVIIADVPDYAVVVGNPGKVVKSVKN